MPHIGGAGAIETDQRLVRAIGHPVRAEALAILNARAASPNQIARELGLDDEFWAKLSDSTRSGITLASLRYLIATARDSLESGLFEARSDRHCSIAGYDLDEQGWAEARELFQATLDQLMDIGAESESRIAAAAAAEPTPALRATFGLLAFESPGGAARAS